MATQPLREHFCFAAPYTTTPTRRWRQPAPPPPAAQPLGEREQRLQDKLTAILAGWAVNHHLLVPTVAGGVPAASRNHNDFAQWLLTTNFRRLVYAEDLKQATTYLRDTYDGGAGSLTTNQLMLLTVQLGTRFEHSFLDGHIDRLYRSLHALHAGPQDHSWAYVHRTYPFMWVLLSLQAILHDAAPLG